MQGWARGAAAGAFVGTALACAGALDAAQTEQVRGRWTCAFEAEAEAAAVRPTVTLRFSGDAAYLESGAFTLEGVLSATAETKDAPPATTEWDSVLAGTWSVKSGKLCSALTDSKFVPRGAPNRLAERLADTQPGDLVPSGLASCDPILELSETLLVTRKEADGTTVTCRRRP